MSNPAWLSQMQNEWHSKILRVAEEKHHQRKIKGILRKGAFDLDRKNKKWRSFHDFKCLRPNCMASCIGSHVLQRQKLSLSIGAAKDGSASDLIITPLAAMKNKGNIFNLAPRAVDGDYAKFPGFCSTDDIALFRDLENGKSTASHERKVQLQAYRTFCRELRRGEHDLKYDTECLEAMMGKVSDYLRGIATKVIPEFIQNYNPEIINRVEYRLPNLQNLRQQLSRKIGDIDAMRSMKPAMDNFITGASTSAGVYTCEIELPVVLPFALSGYGNITPQSPVAQPQVLLFMVVLSNGMTTRIILFGDEKYAVIIHTFLHNKGIQPNPTSPSAMQAFLNLAEQFLVTSTDNWFMSVDAYNGMLSETKERLLNGLDFYHESLGAPWRMELFPAIRNDLPA